MSFLHIIQLGNRADFCRRWDTVALVLQPDTTFCLSITVTMIALMVGGCGSAQPQTKTKKKKYIYINFIKKKIFKDYFNFFIIFLRISNEKVSEFSQKCQVELA